MSLVLEHLCSEGRVISGILVQPCELSSIKASLAASFSEQSLTLSVLISRDMWDSTVHSRTVFEESISTIPSKDTRPEPGMERWARDITGKAHLLHLEWCFDVRDIRINVPLESLQVYRLSYFARHCVCG